MVFKFYFLKKNIFTPFQRKSHTKIYLFIYGQAFHMKKKKTNKQTYACMILIMFILAFLQKKNKIFVMHILEFYSKFIKLIEIVPQ